MDHIQIERVAQKPHDKLLADDFWADRNHHRLEFCIESSEFRVYFVAEKQRVVIPVVKTKQIARQFYGVDENSRGRPPQPGEIKPDLQFSTSVFDFLDHSKNRAIALPRPPRRVLGPKFSPPCLARHPRSSYRNTHPGLRAEFRLCSQPSSRNRP